MAPRLPLFAAPHRGLFLIGVLQLLLVMTWWTLVQANLHAGGPALPEESVPLSLLHAPLMIYLVLPPLFFGFLLTVFPRWIGYPDTAPAAYLPVMLGFAAASLLSWLAIATGSSMLFALALGAAGVGWLWGLGFMIWLLIRERRDGKGPTWHGWSVAAAMLFGFGTLLMTSGFFEDQDGNRLLLANKAGLMLFVLPVFFTVAHRMVPFFAGNVVENYVRWRPFWLLAVYWTASLGFMFGFAAASSETMQACALILAALAALIAVRWWPRAKAPGLLWVLMLSFAWAPVGYALEAAAAAGYALGRAPSHALTIGFAGGMIVAMVTRVTQGHSGRPLAMNAIAWIAFAGIQIAALVRLWAGAQQEAGSLLLISSALFALTLLPWVARNLYIYLTRRADGKAG